MHTIEIEEKGIKLNFPGSGKEFTRQNRIDFAGYVALWTLGEISYEQMKVHLTYKFLNMKRTASLKLDEKSIRIIENVTEISNLADDYFTSETQSGKTSRVIKPDHLVQLLPIVKVAGKKYYGPTDALGNTVYSEYIRAMDLFNEFSKGGDIKILDELIATLYRPQKWMHSWRKLFSGYSGDPRRKYNADLTPHYQKRLGKLPFEVKYAIYLYFASSQHFIANTDDLDIGGGNTVDLSSLFNQSKTDSTQKGIGQLATLYSLAETGVFGNIDDVAYKNTYDVLVFCVEQRNKYKEMERNLKKRQRHVNARKPPRVRR